MTKEEFVELGHAVVKPGYDYYNRLYNAVGGELFLLKQAYRGASVFDILKLKSMSVETASLLVDDLAKFDFDEFTGEFLEGLKKELPEVIRHANLDFDFSKVDGAAEYDACLARKLKAKAAKAAKTAKVAQAAGGDGGGGSSSLAAGSSSSSSSAADDDDVVFAATETAKRVIDAEKWEDDPAEKARRIWEWWKTRVKGVKFFVFWPTALRLVVLVQPSSAFVERVFSQIKLILEQIGVSSLEETVEARTLVRCNTGI